MTDFSGVNRKARNPAGNPKRARLLWNSEHREHKKNSGKLTVERQKKNAIYLSVNVFNRRVLFGNTIFTRDRHFTWSSEPREGLAAYRLKEYLHISVIFKTLSIGPPPGIEPATSRSAVKRSTDCANPARPITIKFRIRKESSKPQTKYHWCLRLSYLAPYWLISRNTITCHKYFWCWNWKGLPCIMVKWAR